MTLRVNVVSYLPGKKGIVANTMLIFLDDSGDPGFKLDKGSSQVFVIACVIFDDSLEAQETDLKIKRLRREIGLCDEYEFRFNKCSPDIRRRFLRAIAECKFRIRGIVVHKNKIHGVELKRNVESFYNYAIKLVLKNNSGTITKAKLRMDRHGEKKMRKGLITYLRREINTDDSKVITDFKYTDSGRDSLIQLADMVAGAIHRSYNLSKIDRLTYRTTIKAREENVWDFPS